MHQRKVYEGVQCTRTRPKRKELQSALSAHESFQYRRIKARVYTRNAHQHKLNTLDHFSFPIDSTRGDTCAGSNVYRVRCTNTIRSACSCSESDNPFSVGFYELVPWSNTSSRLYTLKGSRFFRTVFRLCFILLINLRFSFRVCRVCKIDGVRKTIYAVFCCCIVQPERKREKQNYVFWIRRFASSASVSTVMIVYYAWLIISVPEYYRHSKNLKRLLRGNCSRNNESWFMSAVREFTFGRDYKTDTVRKVELICRTFYGRCRR